MCRQSKALKNFKEVCKRRQANLLDPNWGGSNEARGFPQWYMGMTTLEYIRRFQNLSHTLEVNFVFANKHSLNPAPCLDPYEPEVVLLLDDEVDESGAGSVYP